MSRKPLMLLVLGLLVLTLSERSAAQKNDPEVPFHDDKTGLHFRDVPGFELQEPHRYPQPGLGYSVDYQSERGTHFTVYVYDLQVANIPDGPFSPVVRAQFDQAKKDLFRAQEAGHYQEVEEIKSEVVLLGDDETAPAIRRATFKLRKRDKDYISYVYLTGYRSHFFKVRCTLPADSQAACEKEAAMVFAHLGAMLSGRDDKNLFRPV